MSKDQNITRKLRAILSADVKGYSLLMADDEVATINTLKDYRNIMSACIEQRGGRVVDAVGDNLLAEFESAVDAVQCAVEVQKELKDKNQNIPDDKRLEFRIGVNIGDVIEDGERIFGEGVNVAARIEGLADAGGIFISRNAYDHVKNKLELKFEYLGEHKVKNIQEPVRVYKVLLESDEYKPLIEEKLNLPDKPSIAVLPFTNMSGDPSQEYFSDGLTEQIINGLCKVSNLFVIARNSSFAYKGKSVSVKQVAQELGVKYILEGSVQKVGNRVRITTQLIDAETDIHMWSENYDRDLEDIFALQDEITLKVMHVMELKLTMGEQIIKWSEHSLTDIKAYDLFWRGLECFYRFNREDNSQARTYFHQSLNIDPSPIVYVMACFTHLIDLMYGWSESQIESFDQADKLSQSAYEIDKDLDIVHSALGFINLYKGKYDIAIKEVNKAISLNPNGAESHVLAGVIHLFNGNSIEAVRLIKRGFRLNPYPPAYYYTTLGVAYRSTMELNKSVSTILKSVKLSPNSIPPYIGLAVSYGLLEQVDKAKDAVRKILQLDPNYSVSQFALTSPFRNKEELGMYLDALRKAGLPE